MFVEKRKYGKTHCEMDVSLAFLGVALSEMFLSCCCKSRVMEKVQREQRKPHPTLFNTGCFSVEGNLQILDRNRAKKKMSRKAANRVIGTEPFQSQWNIIKYLDFSDS